MFRCKFYKSNKNDQNGHKKSAQKSNFKDIFPDQTKNFLNSNTLKVTKRSVNRSESASSFMSSSEKSFVSNTIENKTQKSLETDSLKTETIESEKEDEDDLKPNLVM